MGNCLPRHITDSGGSGGGAPGPPGPAGPTGPAGAAGSRWYNAAGVPSVFLGVDGDYYWDTNNGNVYTKIVGAWVLTGSILGPTGAPGAPGSVWYYGAGVPGGGTGVNGDFYYRTSNGDIYNKAGGAWSVVGNITGPVGPAGPAGPAGVGVPTGGGTFDLLGKIDATNYNTAWFPLYTVMDGVFGAAPGTLIQRGLGTWQALAPGSAGQVLTSNGAGAVNSWQTAPGGSSNPKKIAVGNTTPSNTGSTAEISIVPGLSGSIQVIDALLAQFTAYRFMVRGVFSSPAGTNEFFRVRLGGTIVGTTTSVFINSTAGVFREWQLECTVVFMTTGIGSQVWCNGTVTSFNSSNTGPLVMQLTGPTPNTFTAVSTVGNPSFDITCSSSNAATVRQTISFEASIMTP